MLFIASWFYLNIDNRSGIAKAETILLSEKSPYLYTKSPQERLAQIYYYNIDRDKYADRLVHYSWWCIDNEQFSPRPYSYLAGYYTDTGKHEHAVNIALIAENRGITNKFIANLIILIFSQEGLLEQRKPEHIVPVSRDFAFKNPYITSLLSFADSSIALPATHRKSLVELYAISSIIAFFGEAGKFDEARNVFFAGIRLYPYSSILNLNWGSALLSSKDYSGAREQFFLALAKGGDRGKIMNNIALTYLYEGDYSMAEKYFLSAIDASPMVFDLNYNYALFLFSIGKKERAIEKMHDYIARAKYREQEELALGAIEYFNSKATSINK